VSYDYLSSGFQNGFSGLVGWGILRLFDWGLAFVLHSTPPARIVAPPLRGVNRLDQHRLDQARLDQAQQAHKRLNRRLCYGERFFEEK
jgi:hypothetical protein